ncbi:MAG: DUF3604 domain-containing protein [Planctomycetes bacterium]|nr:DUF3604 domain-containing protein [Planctomycetota bacterium]
MKSKLEYEGPVQLRANQLFRAKLFVTPAQTIQTGGRIVVAARHFSDIGDPQTDDPESENYITIDSDASASFKVNTENPGWGRHPWNRGIDLILDEGTIPAGTEILIHLGNPSHGSPGYRCQSFTETNFRFRLGIDPAGNDDWEVLPSKQCPGFKIVGNVATGIKCFARNATRDDGQRELILKPEDRYGNIAGVGPDSTLLTLDGSQKLENVNLEGAHSTKIDIPHDQSYHRLYASTSDGAFYEQSNPFGPSPIEGYRLFWGEIHAQSRLCDGTNMPRELYRYARDAAGLDFAAVTSHDFELTPENWDQVKEATRAAHQPGDFVTFLGYEWSGAHERGGDNNIYFLDDEGPLVYNAPVAGYPEWDPAEGAVDKTRDLRETIEELQGRQFMVVPHCGGRQCNFDFYDPGCMPIFEMHSCHRNYEHVAQEAIRRGLRFGFIGGSDDHRGAIGDSHTTARDRFFSSHSGLVGVYAKELTRESLWKAFFSRRVYATNGPRIILDVRLNGALTGEEITVEAGETLRMEVHAVLDGLLDRIEVFRNTSPVHLLAGGDQANQIEEFTGAYDEAAPAGNTAYYVRVRQTDGGMAWSSPVWVNAI